MYSIEAIGLFLVFWCLKGKILKNIFASFNSNSVSPTLVFLYVYLSSTMPYTHSMSTVLINHTDEEHTLGPLCQCAVYERAGYHFIGAQRPLTPGLITSLASATLISSTCLIAAKVAGEPHDDTASGHDVSRGDSKSHTPSVKGRDQSLTPKDLLFPVVLDKNLRVLLLTTLTHF